MAVKVLDFTGKWCSTCQVLDGILENEIIPRFKNKVEFVKIDAEEDENLTKQYDILSVPTLIILKEGKEIWRKSGSVTKDEVIKGLDKAIR